MRFLKQIFPILHNTIKSLVAQLATLSFYLRGIKLPPYFDESDRIHNAIHGIENDIIYFTNYTLKQGMVVVDVGANVGFLTRQFGKLVGDTGKVLSFEADPSTFEYLKYNSRKLPCVQLFQLAVSDVNGSAQFYLHSRSGASNSLVNTPQSKEMITVKCMTLDDFLDTLPPMKIDFIKIDVEGAELKVLNGMKRTFINQPGMKVILEFCPANLIGAGIEPSDLLSFMKEHSFSIAVIHEDGTLCKFNDLATVHGLIGANGYVNILCTKNPQL